MFRIGSGYDVHRLVAGRDLILGGVKIPYEKGLLGHSDADVLVHAIIDALLGAAGQGDIGTLFPDDDERYKDADSLWLLSQVCVGTVVNIDATIIAEAPKLAKYIPRMRENIARIMECEVNIKATTTEGLGFTGCGEGIAAQAVCLIAKKEGK